MQHAFTYFIDEGRERNRVAVGSHHISFIIIMSYVIYLFVFRFLLRNESFVLIGFSYFESESLVQRDEMYRSQNHDNPLYSHFINQTFTLARVGKNGM
jgi:hypothetical protein